MSETNKKYRIVKQGDTYFIQKRVLFWWFFLEELMVCNDGLCWDERKKFYSLEEARDYIRFVLKKNPIEVIE